MFPEKRVIWTCLPALALFKDHATYKAFLRSVLKACDGVHRCVGALADFDEGLRGAVQKVFDVTCFGDRFHFVQANMKQARRLGLGSSEDKPVRDLLRDDLRSGRTTHATICHPCQPAMG
jgi:uncharacterized protein YkvS